MMTNEYIIKREERLLKEKNKNSYIFGLCFGLAIILVNLIIAISPISSFKLFFIKINISTLTYINVISIILGMAIIISATIYPSSINFLHFIMKKIFSFILILILIITYFILITPIGKIMKARKTEKSEASTFCDYKQYDTKNKGGFISILNIFQMFLSKEYALMIPVLILLIFLGVILFLAQSSAVAPFIYTLF